ncbi:hypothetical protein OOT00_08890 [Desulfobotulus sp. H1]|uniref:Uncharacterized protein n=1 Tax=Desulfobotulus pelophilus TaxID=2823377 RepID=A0ABT3N9F8_9BACT|nr:hypothetical protein [Desulfobotulus pelophilus]MCW7754102.1 hypothetical protein [Desulfobotulus pelophilus]
MEALVALQDQGGRELVQRMLQTTELPAWATLLQQRFHEVLEEKASYLADRSALPYPESWMRLAFKVQALRCISAGQDSLLDAIGKGLDHLACFQPLNPLDRESLTLVERYRDEIRQAGVSPGAEDGIFLSDGTTLREVLQGYTKALPVFNRYHDRVEASKKMYREELGAFIAVVRVSVRP